MRRAPAPAAASAAPRDFDPDADEEREAAPDIFVDGQPLLSFGVGIELAPATFTSP